MALHHALKLLEPQARAALCFFMSGTAELTIERVEVLEKTLQNLRRQKGAKADKKVLSEQYDFLTTVADGLMLSAPNLKTIETHAHEFEMPVAMDRASFLKTVKTLEAWRRDPAVIKALGRQADILERFYFAAITTARMIVPKTLEPFGESALIKYNYCFTVALAAVSLEVTGNSDVLDKNMIDPTWHPLDVGRIAYPVPDEAKIRGTLRNLDPEEQLFLKVMFTDFKSLMLKKHLTVDALVEAMLAKYPRPLAEAFETVYRAFNAVLGEKESAVSELMVKLVNTRHIPDIILRLRLQMVYAEPTPFISALTSPVKLLATVMDLYLDGEGDTVTAGLLMGLLNPEATEQNIRAHYQTPVFKGNLFDDLLKNVPAQILAPTILTIDLLLPLLAEVFSEDGIAQLEKKSGGTLKELCPIFKSEERWEMAAGMGEAFVKMAEEFHAKNPALVASLDDVKAVRHQLLKLPEYFKYIAEMPASGPEDVPPGDMYYGIMTVWAFAIDTLPTLLKMGYLRVNDEYGGMLNLFFRIVLQITRVHGDKLMGQDEWQKKLEDSVEEFQKQTAEKTKAAEKRSVGEQLNDEVPEGTVFN